MSTVKDKLLHYSRWVHNKSVSVHSSFLLYSYCAFQLSYAMGLLCVCVCSLQYCSPTHSWAHCEHTFVWMYWIHPKSRPVRETSDLFSRKCRRVWKSIILKFICLCNSSILCSSSSFKCGSVGEFEPTTDCRPVNCSCVHGTLFFLSMCVFLYTFLYMCFAVSLYMYMCVSLRWIITFFLLPWIRHSASKLRSLEFNYWVPSGLPFITE